MHRVVPLAFVLALLAACAGPVLHDGAERPRPDRSVQLAQADVESDALEEEGNFGDLFPSDDSLALEEDFDPFEIVNRFVFAINEAIDFAVLQPVATTYEFILPQVVRDSVRNVTRNLKAPVIFLNEMWQGQEERASTTFVRFLINSTLGLAGLFDVAGSWGYAYHEEDFGQTLGSYGAGPGPYLVLPLFGPSTLRDAIGLGVDTLLDPWPYVLDAAEVEKDKEILLGRRIAAGVDLRARNLDTVADLKRDSVDFYARIRSLYLQNRRALIDDRADTDSETGGDAPSLESNQ
jgi:phospholipid-binding lipoprotein MlaA